MVATLVEPLVADVNRRWFMGVAGAAALGLAGCGTPESQPGRAPAPGFPVQVDGKFGPTVVDKPPQRVVALGIGPDACTLLALGVLPVAMAADSTLPGGIPSWVQDALQGRQVELLDSAMSVPFEKVAALKPDLIVATTQYTLPQDHERLSRIAPVLAYATAPNTDRWQETTTRVGQVLGLESVARQRVTETENKIASIRAAHPEFAGKTFTFGPVAGPDSVFTISDHNDLSAAFLQDLGLVMSPRVAGLPPSATRGKSQVSMEQLDILDADVMLLTYTTTAPGVRENLEANPLFQKVPAVQRGAYVQVDLPTAIAIAFPSVLSLSYGLDRLVDQIAGALR